MTFPSFFSAGILVTLRIIWAILMSMSTIIVAINAKLLKNIVLVYFMFREYNKDKTYSSGKSYI